MRRREKNWAMAGVEGVGVGVVVCGCSNFFLFKSPSWASQVRLSGKASACKCRRCERCRFNFWVRKILWRTPE